MTNQQTKILINCSYGENDLERATITFILALSSASQGAETAVFATAGAANFCVKGGGDGMEVEGYGPIANVLDDYIANGGSIWLCPICAKAKGISVEDLRPGVEISGVPRIMEFMENGAQLMA